jgi:hypothetical protein
MVRIAVLGSGPIGAMQVPNIAAHPRAHRAAEQDTNHTAAVSGSRAGVEGVRNYRDVKLVEVVVLR